MIGKGMNLSSPTSSYNSEWLNLIFMLRDGESPSIAHLERINGTNARNANNAMNVAREYFLCPKP